MKCYYGVDFKEQREKLLKSDAAQVLIKDIIARADEALNEEYKALKISDYMLFIETGDRKTFEREYFKRRNNCSYISIAYWLTEDEKYKKHLVNLIFHICDEYTWCLPAHADLGDEPDIEYVVGKIDLFQSETGRLLTDIYIMLSDKLPYYVKNRIEYELRRRIIVPVQTRSYWWQDELCTNNWSAVCAGGTGVAVLHFATDEEKKKILPLLDGAMKTFLKGFRDDGCCLEGYSYWNYGFGYYLIYAMAMLAYSNGEVNMFDNPKVKQIAFYPQRTRMGQTKTVSFSDGGNAFAFSPGTFSLLRKVYGKEFQYPPLSLATNRGNVYSVKELLWFDTEYEEDKDTYCTTFFKDSEWYIKRSEHYSFAAKGGNNNEPHNHNDVGSFMIITKDDTMPLADLGAAIYRKETFESEHRYKLLNNSSRGHSVPVINGQYQGAEKDYYKAENVKAGEDFFEADIEGAYEKGLVERINRRFELKEKSIVLCDTITYSDKTEEVTERLISLVKPEINDGYVDLKSLRVMFDEKKYTVILSSDSYRNHADTADVDVYIIDFKGKDKNETEFKFEICVD